MSVLERFLRYVRIDTQSADDRDMVPSTEKQWDLARVLVQELKEMGAADVRLSEHCYVYARIPATAEVKGPKLGFIAHMDTATALTGTNVNPRVIEHYDGEDIVLNSEADIIMSTEDFPALKKLKGHRLVVTDGTTLLGGDDKAGVAEIMTLTEYLLAHPEIPHGEIEIGFTPDEEVGHGVDFFDVEGFGADAAYTVDGGALGELEYENFNAASAKVRIQGLSIHPGSAKGKMKNALLIGMELQQMLPKEQNPMYTEGYEGFFHLDEMNGTVENAEMVYIIRDHDRARFEEKKELFRTVCNFLNTKYGEGTVDAEIRDSYYNMKEMIEPHMELIEKAVEAMRSMDVEPMITPIRGGTDGARLSYMGLPCPNLGTGGGNCHGKFEYVSADEMEKTVLLLLKLACG